MIQINIDKTFVILIIVIICLIIIYKYNYNYYHYNQQLNNQQLNNQSSNLNVIPNIKVNIQQKDIESILNNNIQPPPIMPDPITNLDYRNIDDILTGPIKRPTRDAIGPVIGNPLFNIYTQGPPDSYSWIGILTADASSSAHDPNNKLIKLFGRQRYPNSNTWDYYVLSYAGGSGSDTIKISLNKDKYRRELYDGDHVHIHELGMTYKVKLNRDDFMNYNPYII
jgi:hypothetical protein